MKRTYKSPSGTPAGTAAEGDLLLRELLVRPFALRLPEHARSPFIFASPHSGSVYPGGFLAQSQLAGPNLRRSEDAYVDELFFSVTSLGAPLLAANFPRAYVDANRAPVELDPAMFDSSLGLPVDATSPRVHAGLGVIPRLVRDGAEIYREKLAAAEAHFRLQQLHRPYHAALARLVDETFARYGVAVIVDCHSMPSAAAAPDIVLGDRYGSAASQILMRTAEKALAAVGFRTVRNVPYAGGYTTSLYGRPSCGLHALQVEVNRALYLDEERIVRSHAFTSTARRIAEAFAAIVSLDPAILRPDKGLGLAAE